MRAGPMRLLFVSHSKEVGGAESYLASLMLRATAEARDVTLVCRRDPALDDWLRGLTDKGVTVERLDFRQPAEYRRFMQLARRSSLVHLVLAYPVGKYQLAAAGMARLAGRALIVTHQLSLDLDAVPMSPLRRWAWSNAFRSYRFTAQHHIAVSKFGADLLVERYHFPSARVSVIPNGVELRGLGRLGEPARTTVRQQLAQTVGFDGGEPGNLLVLTVARLNLQKGLFDLIDAVSLVQARIASARFLLIGGGELEEALGLRIAELGLQSTVFLTGARPREVVVSWLGAADLFVLPSHSEGLPLALVEAMAAGCAAVATRVGGVPEVIADSSMGQLVPPRDPGALAAAIVELLADPMRREAISARGVERVRNAFDLEACLERTLALYPGLAR